MLWLLSSFIHFGFKADCQISEPTVKNVFFDLNTSIISLLNFSVLMWHLLWSWNIPVVLKLFLHFYSLEKTILPLWHHTIIQKNPSNNKRMNRIRQSIYMRENMFNKYNQGLCVTWRREDPDADIKGKLDLLTQKNKLWNCGKNKRQNLSRQTWNTWLTGLEWRWGEDF